MECDEFTVIESSEEQFRLNTDRHGDVDMQEEVQDDYAHFTSNVNSLPLRHFGAPATTAYDGQHEMWKREASDVLTSEASRFKEIDQSATNVSL